MENGHSRYFGIPWATVDVLLGADLELVIRHSELEGPVEIVHGAHKVIGSHPIEVEQEVGFSEVLSKTQSTNDLDLLFASVSTYFMIVVYNFADLGVDLLD